MTDDDTSTASTHAQIRQALDEYATQLATTDPTTDADLAPLRDRLCDAHVVGLGEATHGTREFFRLKHRLLRYLVTECGVRAFALEANVPETRAIDEYVVHGTGDPREALDGIYFWTWNVESVLDLIEWLREFNADRPLDDRVRFYGVDVQYTRGAVEHLREYLDAADPEFLAEVEPDLDAVADDDENPPHDDDAPGPRIEAAERVLPSLTDRLADRREEYVAATSKRDWDLARQDLWVLERAIEFKRAWRDRRADDADEVAARERCLRVRDRAMADAVDWILDREDGPVVAWAHDAHLNRVEQKVRDGEAAAASMGNYLADRHGDDYVAVGFAFARGSFQAIGDDPDSDDDDPEYSLREWTLDDPLPDTFEATLSDLDHSLAILDVRSAADDDRLTEWLSTPRPHFSIGASYDPEDPAGFLTEHVFADAFDVVCYVGETTRARPLDVDS